MGFCVFITPFQLNLSKYQEGIAGIHMLLRCFAGDSYIGPLMDWGGEVATNVNSLAMCTVIGWAFFEWLSLMSGRGRRCNFLTRSYFGRIATGCWEIDEMHAALGV